MYHLSCLEFSELLASVICYFLLIFGKLQPLSLQVFILSHTVFSFWSPNCTCVRPFYVVPQLLNVLFCFFLHSFSLLV